MKRPVTALSALRYPGRLMSKKQFVFIASAQRSGSTLLKALLAVAPDVSHLSEVPFHYYHHFTAWQLKALSDKPILVLKKPSWAGEKNYPTIPPVGEHQVILLIRHPYETLISTGKMYAALQPDFWERWNYHRLLYEYWLPTYESILTHRLVGMPHTTIVRYEELTEDPIAETQRLYQFIGSRRTEGTDTYQKRSEEWTFKEDDGSDRIKSLRVQPAPIDRKNDELLSLIENEPRVNDLLDQFGY
ncbi:sulfotransferase [Lewinella sp. 4G2]|uniref:sulfotransferase family protein n=1 Tax=Lewinella sp. 4G2 TaxID=1803372 RepID=UPI0007B4C183|nr:sulfotransferase [Lewinella sp. 4G2]OAV43688.1 hypothetical protein A3850_003875 [Lewinella sp. 4G2]